MRPPIRRLSALVLLHAVVLVLACRSSAGKEETPSASEPYVPLPDPEPETLGYFLRRLDASLESWSRRKLSASSAREQNQLSALERELGERARKRRDELLETLEAGSPANRRIAAAGLGFTGDPSVLGALLASLSERDPELVQKALLGIGVLGRAETPLAGVRERLLHDPDDWTRNNAAFALLAIARSGNRSSELAESCRSALSDREAGVRAQCASALGMLADAESVSLLAELLYDDANLAALASAAALARIGRERPEQKGTVARALAAALDRVRGDRRAHLLGALRWLADRDLGQEARAWLEWAHKFP